MLPPEGATPARRTLLELAVLEKCDYHATLQRILQADAEGLDVDRVAYWHLGDDEQTLSSVLAYIRSLQLFERGVTITAAQYPSYFRALREEQVILAHNAEHDPRTSELQKGYLRPLGISSMMDVPVWSRGRLVGVLCHEHTGPARTWTSTECDLALAVAQTIATTHEASARIQAEELARRALFLLDATEALALTLDVEQVPQQLMRFAVRDIADWGMLEALDERGRLVRLATAHHDRRCQELLDELELHHPRRTPPSHLALRVLGTGRSLLFPTVSDEVLRRFGVRDDVSRAIVRKLGGRSGMLVPLVARGRVVAALTLASGSRVFGREDLQLAEDLARRGAVHLDNVRLYREAREAVRARDDFIAVASHELNTPLTSLGLAVDALRSGLFGKNPGAMERASDLIQRQQRRLTRLVREMLDVTRIQAGRLVLRRTETNLSALLRELCKSYEPEVEPSGGSLRCHIEDDIRGLWDRGRLERVAENLLSNAVKFGAGGPVELTLRSRPDDIVELRITDHGVGIPYEQQRFIFDRFERAVSTREYAGLGLGLYIARGIVTAHGGTIRVASVPGQGSTFTVELPRGAGGEPTV